MAKPCSVCTHKNLSAITRALVQGVPLRTVAAENGLTLAALGRHRLKCSALPPQKVVRAERKEVERAREVLENLPSKEHLGGLLVSFMDRLDSIAAACEAEGSNALAISAIDKLRLNVESLARLAGHAGSGADRSVHVNVGVAISADQIASSLSSHLGKVSRAQALEALNCIEVKAGE